MTSLTHLVTDLTSTTSTTTQVSTTMSDIGSKAASISSMSDTKDTSEGHRENVDDKPAGPPGRTRTPSTKSETFLPDLAPVASSSEKWRDWPDDIESTAGSFVVKFSGDDDKLSPKSRPEFVVLLMSTQLCLT